MVVPRRDRLRLRLGDQDRQPDKRHKRMAPNYFHVVSPKD
jgi:hypothetical protein